MPIQPKYLAPITYAGADIGQGQFGVASGAAVLSPVINRSVNTVFADLITFLGRTEAQPTSGSFRIYIVPLDTFALTAIVSASAGLAVGQTENTVGNAVLAVSMDYTALANGGTWKRFHVTKNVAELFGGVVPSIYRILWVNGLDVKMRSQTGNGGFALMEAVGVAAESV